MFELINIEKGRVVAALPTINGRSATAGETVADGDTVNAVTEGLLQVRFCSIDTPEMGLTAPINDAFKKKIYLPTEKFEDYLLDPFDKKFEKSPDFLKALGQDFVEEYLKKKLHKDTAINHKRYAEIAREELRRLIEDDIRLSSQFGKDYFRFQIDFPYEVLDRYGRFLGWVKRFESDDKYAKGIVPYGDLLVEKGMAFPYFIWPSISTAKRNYHLQQLVPPIKDFSKVILDDDRIRSIRLLAGKARERKLGIYSLQDNNELLLPFELRFLVERNYGMDDSIPISSFNGENNERGYRKPLFRYVIDLSKPDDPILMKPNNYYKVRKYEDRLFIPPEYVHLFKEKGYRQEQ